MSGKKYKKVLPYNDRFSLPKFLKVLRESIPVIFLIFFVSILGGFLYLRYTPPLYEAYSIIQINKDEATSQLLNVTGDLTKENDGDLPHTVELLRSKEFLKRVFGRLPLKVGYFREGTFLREEIYKTTPFHVQFRIENTGFYNLPFYVNFRDKHEADLLYTEGGKEVTKHIQIGKWQKIDDGLEFKIIIDNFRQIQENYKKLKSNEYLFIVYDDRTLFKQNFSKLQIFIENRLAKTIRIQFADNNPNKVTDMVNTIAEEFLKYDVETKKESTKKILEFIEKQSAIVYEKLNYLDRKLRKFGKRYDYYLQDANLSSVYVEKLNELEEKKMELNYELSTLKTIQSLLNTKKEINIYEIVGLLSGLDVEQSLISALNNLQQLMDKRENLLSELQPDNFKIKQIDQQIEKQKLLFSTLITSVMRRINDDITKIENKISQYRSKLDIKQVDEVEKSRLMRLYKVNEEYYNNLLEKKAEYLIYQAGYVSNNTILEKATVPTIPVLPRKNVVVISVLVLALVVSLVFVIIKYLFYTTLLTTQDVSDYTDVPIIGMIPKHSGNNKYSSLVVDAKSATAITEAFRQLRTNLEFYGFSKDKKVIAVTSTVSGEGKSFVSINLAGIIAGLGKKVILLDLDLRRPRLHKGFNVENNKGVSTILVGKHSIEECINNNVEGGFDFIPAGKEPPNPAELVSKNEMNELLEYLESKYDVVIMDTPPVGLVIDAFPVYKKADIQLYVLRSEFSHKTFINNINYLRYDMNMEHLALVFNSIRVKSTGYGYSYGYGSGYVYGYGYGYGNMANFKKKKRFFKGRA